MIKELKVASNLLNTALEGYLAACLSSQCFTQGRTFDSTQDSQKLVNRVADELLSAASFETKIHQAKVAISRARNRTSAIVLISILPIEIMVAFSAR
jgi:hypothetical protein